MAEAKVESPYFSEAERKAQLCGLLERLREKLKKLREDEQMLVAEIGKLENEEAKRAAESKANENAAKWDPFVAGHKTAKLWIDPWDYLEVKFVFPSEDNTRFTVMTVHGSAELVWIEKKEGWKFNVPSNDYLKFEL